MIALVYNNKAFKMQDEYTITNSTNEVTFSDITIDFTGKTLADIPFKYQKMEIRESEDEANILNGEILFTGYLDEIKLPDMKQKDEYRTLELTLLSPLKMATVRTVSLIGTYETVEAITRVLQPLLDDGFIIKELNISDGQITTNFIMETIENCMNNICSKKNIFWYINEKREIYIRDIDLMLNRTPVMTIDENNKLSEIELDEFEPEIENVDYANIINIKNIKLKYQANKTIIYAPDEEGVYEEVGQDWGNYPIITPGRVINPGDTVNFLNPIIIDENTLREYMYSLEKNVKIWSAQTKFIAILIEIDTDSKDYPINYETEDVPHWEISIDTQATEEANRNKYIISNGISFSDDEEEKEIVLQRDQTFKNLITGFKFNGNRAYKLNGIITDTGLRKTNLKFMHTQEIEKLKGIISDSGQIEKTVDFNEKWVWWEELSEYAKNLIIQNTNLINEVTLHFTKNIDLKIGDIIEIKMLNYYTEGFFAVTEIEKTYINDDEIEISVVVKKSNFVSTYIDMFRPEEKEESEQDIDSILVGTLSEEGISETHNITESGENNEN